MPSAIGRDHVARRPAATQLSAGRDAEEARPGRSAGGVARVRRGVETAVFGAQGELARRRADHDLAGPSPLPDQPLQLVPVVIGGR